MQVIDAADETTEQVTAVDQASINAFARANRRANEIDDLLSGKKELKGYLDDLTMELELVDEDELVPYQISSTFFQLPAAKANELVTKQLSKLDESIASLTEEADACASKMSDLRTKLYAKFGRAINLEP